MKPRLLAQLLVPPLTVCAVLFGTGSTSVAAQVCDPPAPMKVPSTGTVVGTGTAASCTEAALRSAVAAGGRVTFDCGAAATIAVTAPVNASRTTVIDGAGKVTLDGGRVHRILVAQNGTSLSVRNLTLVNGAAAGSMDRAVGAGGAVAGMFRSHLEVIGSTFGNNSAGLGGGAVGGGANTSVTVVNSTFTGNTAWYGGAIYTLLAPLTIVNSTFTDNSTTTTGGLGDGGAIGTDGAAATPGTPGGVIRICGSVVRHNSGHGNGGGAYLWTYAPDKIIIDRSTFADNTVTSNGRNNSGIGGGARISVGPESGRVGSISVTASSIQSNTSGANGGGFYLDCPANCAITDTTFAGNSSGAYGGAIFGDSHHDTNVTFANNSAAGHGGALFGSKFVLTNTVFVGNSAHNPWGQAMSCSSTGTGSHVMQWGTGGRDRSNPCVSGAVAADPRLAAPAANGGPTSTMMPAANSPVLNAGTQCPSSDQRGAARNTAVCDLGAVQRTPYSSPSASPSASAATPSAAGSVSVAASVELAGAAGTGGRHRGSGVPWLALLGTAAVATVAALAAVRVLRRPRRGTRRAGTGSRRELRDGRTP